MRAFLQLTVFISTSRSPREFDPAAFAAMLVRLSRAGCPEPQIFLKSGSNQIKFVRLATAQLRTYHSLPATRVHEHRKSDRGSEPSELTIQANLGSYHRITTALHSPNDVTRGSAANEALSGPLVPRRHVTVRHL